MKREKGKRGRGLRIPGPRRSVPFLLLETQNPCSFPLFIVEVLPVQVINPHIAIAAQISVKTSEEYGDEWHQLCGTGCQLRGRDAPGKGLPQFDSMGMRLRPCG